LRHKLVSGRAERPLALPEEVVMSITQSITAQTLTKEEAVWLLSILDDEDWREGSIPRQEALRVASS
jgi:hypothetical protein